MAPRCLGRHSNTSMLTPPAGLVCSSAEIWGDNQIRIIPEMATARQACCCVVLPDGRPVVIGGFD